MLDFDSIANQLESDGHHEMSEAIREHGAKMSDVEAACNFYKACHAEPESASNTGAFKDALKWLRTSAFAACNAGELAGSTI